MKRLTQNQRERFQKVVDDFQKMISRNEELCENPEAALDMTDEEWEKFNEEYDDKLKSVAYAAVLFFGKQK